VTLTEHALRGAVVRAGAVNRLSVGLPWYRSLPLSAVLGIELRLDDEPVIGLRLRLQDRAVDVSELAELGSRSWFLQDRQLLEWAAPAPSSMLPDVVLRIRLQLPNLVGPDGSAVQVVQEVRSRVAVEPAG
jgi:hypothetical protein